MTNNDKTNMKANEIKEKLRSLNACIGAMEWSEGKTLEQIWAECPRGDWMLWLIYYAKVDKRLHTLAKGRCAETVIHLMKDHRSKDAVRAAIDFGNGLIDSYQLVAAYAAAYDAAAAAAAAAYEAAAAYDAAALNNNRLLTANICREVVTYELILKHLTE